MSSASATPCATPCANACAKADPPLPPGFTVHRRHPGKTPADGIYAGQETNWYYEATDNETATQAAILYCQPGAFTIVDLDRLADISAAGVWSIMSNGYPGTHTTETGGERSMMTLHSFLMGHRGHGVSAGRILVQHINKDRLDNRMANLRLVNQRQQNLLRPKCRRQRRARPLPDGIVQSDMPKYVCYVEDVLRKKKPNGTIEETPRAYFVVSCHPLQLAKASGEARFYRPEYDDVNPRFSSTKSKFKSPREKLEQARAYVELLDTIAAKTGFVVPGSIEEATSTQATASK
jgi:hypothetical protein